MNPTKSAYYKMTWSLMKINEVGSSDPTPPPFPPGEQGTAFTGLLSIGSSWLGSCWSPVSLEAERDQERKAWKWKRKTTTESRLFEDLLSHKICPNFVIDLKGPTKMDERNSSPFPLVNKGLLPSAHPAWEAVDLLVPWRPRYIDREREDKKCRKIIKECKRDRCYKMNPTKSAYYKMTWSLMKINEVGSSDPTPPPFPPGEQGTAFTGLLSIGSSWLGSCWSPVSLEAERDQERKAWKWKRKTTTESRLFEDLLSHKICPNFVIDLKGPAKMDERNSSPFPPGVQGTAFTGLLSIGSSCLGSCWSPGSLENKIDREREAKTCKK